MYLLLRDYLSERMQAHFDALQLPQTDKILEHKSLVDALRIKGAIQEEEAHEESNIFHWPWSLKGDDTDPLFLKHCCLRFFYTYSGGKWEKRQLYFTMGLFSTFACKNEKPDELADEIKRIDNELIPLWMKEFETLTPKEVMDHAMRSFFHQRHKFQGKELVLDTSDYLPYAITFEGFCLLAMRLPSPIAAKVHLGIIETISTKDALHTERQGISTRLGGPGTVYLI